MSTFGTGLVEGGNLVANADLSAKQFYAVKQTTTARKVDLASTGGESITGILQNTPKAGEPVEVCYSGFTKALAGTGGFTAGDALQTETGTGKLITQSSTNAKVAVACETCAAGEIGLVRVVGTPG
jgi:Uncharacterized conserved protein (DUF2190)